MFALYVVVLALLLAYAAAECPNACSSHGKCSEFDQCHCYRNWMANDCSERICQFGLSHVDSPLGDLDASGGALHNFKTGGNKAAPALNHSQIFPYGVYEQFPRMLKWVNDVATEGDKVGQADADHVVLEHTGHYYSECSNKGICDRDAGECSCFPGYEGSACQRASCPATKEGVCSGHGVCKSIKELAEDDHENHYLLWDADVTMGCSCDAGWTGPDCSSRSCKYGYDPLFYDNENTVRYSNFTFVIFSDTGSTETFEGTYSLKFYDVFGEDWETDPIDISTHASDSVLQVCDRIRKAMENIPNDVIPGGTMKCQALKDTAFKNQYTNNGNSGAANYPLPTNFLTLISYTLAFPNNPGVLKQPEFNFYLDGSRPSAHTQGGNVNKLKSWIYANGYQGEEVDIVSDYCENVVVEIKKTNNIWHLTTKEPVMVPLLKKCLGEADMNPYTTAVDIYDWDYGTPRNPHLVKLVDRSYKQNGDWTPATALCNTTTETTDGSIYSYFGAGSCLNSNPPGFYAVLFYAIDVSTNDIAAWNQKSPSELASIDGLFVLFQQFGLDYSDRTGNFGGVVYFDLFTTTGTMQIVSEYIHAYNYVASADSTTRHQNKMYTVLAESEDSNINYKKDRYDVSCEYSLDADNNFKYSYGPTSGRESQKACLDKGDTVFFLNVQVPFSYGAVEGNGYSLTDLSNIFNSSWLPNDDAYNYNPMYINYYTVEKVGRKESMTMNPSNHSEEALEALNEIVLDKNLNFNYQVLDHISSVGIASGQHSVWPYSGRGEGMLTAAKIYKFYLPPADKLTATYATQCSGRGICNGEEGLCECFTGYTGDACSLQSALAE